MLFAYFDESCEHARDTGKVTQVSLGGCLATEEAWREFDAEWMQALPPGMAMFHMTDFEARQDVCRDWEPEQRNAFLNSLLDIMRRHIVQFFGFTAGVAIEEKRPFLQGYKDGLLSGIFEITGVAKALGEEKIALVFADHPEFSLSRITGVLGEIDHGDTKLVSASVANPLTVHQLQAADIIAYETSRFHRNTGRSLLEARYPLRELGKYGKGIALHWSLQTQARQGLDNPHLRFSARDAFVKN